MSMVFAAQNSKWNFYDKIYGFFFKMTGFVISGNVKRWTLSDEFYDELLSFGQNQSDGFSSHSGNKALTCFIADE